MLRMKTCFWLCFLCFCCGLQAAAQSVLRAPVMRQRVVATSWVGKPAPDFTLQTTDGQTIRLCDLKGKVVLLDFWASWCGPCLRELPSIEKLHREFKNKDVVILGVNAEDPDDARAFVKAGKLTFPTLLDSARRVGQLYQIRAIPTVIVIDAQGTVVEHFIGVRPEEDLRDAIETAQTGTVKTVAKTQVQPSAGQRFAPEIEDEPVINAPTVKLDGRPHPNALNVVLPTYPEAAQAAQISGAVEVRLLTTAQGKAANIQVMSGDPALRAAVLAAVKQWTFRPTLTMGRPTPTEYRLTFVFALPRQ